MKLGNLSKLGAFGHTGNEIQYKSSEPVDIDVLKVYPKSITIHQDGSAVDVHLVSKTDWSIIVAISDSRIKWKIGDGYISPIPVNGSGDADLSISSDRNLGESRSQDVIFTSVGKDGRKLEEILTIHQYGESDLGYDGCFASTPVLEYKRTADGEYANSVFDENVDIILDGGRA